MENVNQSTKLLPELLLLLLELVHSHCGIWQGDEMRSRFLGIVFLARAAFDI